MAAAAAAFTLTLLPLGSICSFLGFHFSANSNNSPIPGATASGRFATAPMRKHAIREVAAVAVIRLRRTSCCKHHHHTRWLQHQRTHDQHNAVSSVLGPAVSSRLLMRKHSTLHCRDLTLKLSDRTPIHNSKQSYLTNNKTWVAGEAAARPCLGTLRT